MRSWSNAFTEGLTMRRRISSWTGACWILGLMVGLIWYGYRQSAATIPDPGQVTNALLLHPPAEVVEQFLKAIREGDEKGADELLTQVAREKTKEADLHVAPPGSSTAVFSVGKQTVDGSQAKVASTWSDLDDEGKKQTDEIVWLLKKEPAGWRISGMSTDLFPGEASLILNFEDPNEMLERQQKAEAEMVKRAAKGIK
jgi:hypothetical protein